MRYLDDMTSREGREAVVLRNYIRVLLFRLKLHHMVGFIMGYQSVWRQTEIRINVDD